MSNFVRVPEPADSVAVATSDTVAVTTSDTVAAATNDTVAAACQLLVDVFERVIRTERHRAVDEIAATELSISQLRMLFVLAECRHPVSVNELSDAVGLSLAGGGRGADRLVSMGLIDRREDSGDRRIKRLSLTEAGHTLIDECFRVRPEALRPGVSDMPDDARAQLIAALTTALPYLHWPADGRVGCGAIPNQKEPS